MYDFSFSQLQAMGGNWLSVAAPALKLIVGVAFALMVADWIIGSRPQTGSPSTDATGGSGLLGRFGRPRPRKGHSLGKVPTWRNEDYYQGTEAAQLKNDPTGGWGVLEDHARSVNKWEG